MKSLEVVHNVHFLDIKSLLNNKMHTECKIHRHVSVLLLLLLLLLCPPKNGIIMTKHAKVNFCDYYLINVHFLVNNFLEFLMRLLENIVLEVLGLCA